MIEDTAAASASEDQNSAAERPASGAAPFVPQFALDAADAKISEFSGLITDAADTIERLIGTESLPVPEAVRELVTSTTQKLRKLGTTAGSQDSADLIAGLQRAAAAHPAASLGIGAAVGATLAALLVRVAPSAKTASTAGRTSRDADRPTSKSKAR